MEAARLQREGHAVDEARRLALATFGGVERYRQEMREGRRANWFHDLRDDLRYGIRMLLRQKGLTTIAILSLAVGIGANAAIFSVVNSMLLRARPFARPEQLVELYYGDREQPYQTVSYPVYLDFRERNHAFSGLAAYGLGWQFRLGMPNEVRFVWGEVVSGNYFDVLGIRPHLGRTFLPEEDSVPGRNPVVVLGFALWQRDFGADSSIIGRSIRLNDQPMTVVGVASGRFGGMIAGWSTDLWIPAMTVPLIERTGGELRIEERGSKWVSMIGRLKPGVTVQQARSEVDALAAGMRSEHPDDWVDPNRPERQRFMTTLTERETRVHPQLRVVVQALAALVFVIVNLVLVIACMNLAGLLFARAVSRRGEIGMRMALGAGRFRIIRQLLTESILLSFIAGGAGLLLATWALDVLIASMPTLPAGVRVTLDIRLDWRVVVYTLGFATVTGMLFGLAPALQSARFSLSSVLKDDQLAFAGKSRPSRSRRLLIVGQVAASLLLLIGAGLMTRSLGNIRPTRLGFANENFLVASLSLDERTHDRRSAHRAFEQMASDVAALPGVTHASLVDAVPGGFLSRSRMSIEVEGYTARPDEDMEIDRGIVGPGYFTNLNVPFVLGRDFQVQDRDGAPCVGIINDVFATRYFGGAAIAAGKHLIRRNPETDQAIMCEIVGVVRDAAWQSLEREPRPFFYLPYLQVDRQEMTMIVGTIGDPEPFRASVRRALQRIEPSMPVDAQTLYESFSAALYPFKAFGMVLVGGGLMALLLATIGIYGTVSYSVAQRRREVGIRMALGAERSDILRVVVGQGMTVVAYGLAIGLVLGILLTRVLVSLPLVRSLLFGVSAIDVATFVGVTLLLGVVALIACYIPALRAARIDPGMTLRGL
jgi:macrolide transport system ATP-binding/permease protein